MTGDALALLGVNLCYVPAGLGLLRLLGGWRRLPEIRLRLGLAYLTGFAAVGTISTLLLVAGAALSRWQFLVVCASLAASGALGRGRPAPVPLRAGRFRLAVAALVAMTVAFLVLLAVDLAYQPLWATDAWVQWTPKAKAIVLYGGLNPAFLRSIFNSDYPHLVPALEAVDFRFMGGFDTVVVHLQWWCLVAGLVAGLADVLRDRVRPLVLWIVLATLVFAPSLSIQAAYAIADVPLAIFVALASVAAWRWLEDAEPLYLGLLALFSAAALATKVEGELYVAALFVVAAALAWRPGGVRRLLPLGAAGAVALVGIVPWRLWTRAHHLHDYYGGGGGGLARIGRVPTSAVSLAKEIADPTSWLSLVLLALVAAVLALRARRTHDAALLLGPALLVFLAFLWVYWNTPLEVHKHLATSARRVIDGMVLAWAALAPLALERSLPPDEPQGTTTRTGGELASATPGGQP